MSMALTFYWYPNCGSCRKAKKWLDQNNIKYDSVHIVEDPPNEEEILNLMTQSNVPPRRFFNTSGRVYRELNMKDKLKDATRNEMASYLASDGMLIKRPIITDGEIVTVGFNEEKLNEVWI